MVKVSVSLVNDEGDDAKKKPTGYVDPESDGGLEDDLNSRRYRAMLPEDDYDSDDY